MEKYIIIFVEGYGDEIFFEALIKSLKQNCELHLWKIENLKAIGQYSQKAFRIYKNRIFKEAENYEKIIFFAYDTDVFQEPPFPVDWNKVEEKFSEFDNDAQFVHIKVDRNLEDWLMEDVQGICKMLNLEVNQIIIEELESLETGYDKISYLFKKANNVYTKDQNDIKKLCEIIDFEKIAHRLSFELERLIKEIKK